MIQKYLKKLEFNEICKKLSLYCKTVLGKEMALNLEPICDEVKIKKLLEEVSDANALINSFGNFPIGEISDLSLCFKKLESSISLNSLDLLNMANLLKTSRELTSYYKDSELELNYLCSYFDNLYFNLNIENKIFSSIISENEIADTASSKLNTIRREKKNLEQDIKNKLNQMLHS